MPGQSDQALVVKVLIPILRVIVAVGAGNAAGYGAFRGALALAPLLWSVGRAGTSEDDYGTRAVLTALTAILFAAPPVLVGALSARLAGRYGAAVGAASALWAFGFAQWWPRPLPFLPPDAWIGPTVLVMLSGLMGGWAIETRMNVKALAESSRITRMDE